MQNEGNKRRYYILKHFSNLCLTHLVSISEIKRFISRTDVNKYIEFESTYCYIVAHILIMVFRLQCIKIFP